MKTIRKLSLMGKNNISSLAVVAIVPTPMAKK